MNKSIAPKTKTSTDISSIPLPELAKQFESMNKEQLLQVVRAHLLPIADPEKYKETIRGLMPEFVKEMDTKEDIAASVFDASQEFLLVVIDCLKRYHSWSDLEIKKLHKELVDVLTGVKEFEKSGLSILSPHSVGVVGDKVQDLGINKLLAEIAETRFVQAKMYKAGLQVPNQLEGSKLDRALQKPRR